MKTQYYRISKSGTYAWVYDQKVIEGIGGLGFLFPRYELAEDLNDGLRCYSDSAIGYYNTGLIQSCDSVLTLIKELPLSHHFKIYPTIFHKSITIENHSDLKYEVLICNSVSKIFKEESISSNKKSTLDLSFLPSGMYLIYLINGKEIIAEKIIKI